MIFLQTFQFIKACFKYLAVVKCQFWQFVNRMPEGLFCILRDRSQVLLAVDPDLAPGQCSAGSHTFNVWFAIHVLLAQQAVGNPHELQNPRMWCDAS